MEKTACDVTNAAGTVRSYYSANGTSLSCNTAPVPMLVSDTSTVECPFGDNICLNGTAVEVQAKSINSRAHLGINARSDERVTHDRHLVCAPLNSRNYSKPVNDSEGNLERVEYYYEPQPGIDRYDPVAQNDAAESSCGDSENEPLVNQYTRLNLTLKVAHGNRRVRRRFLNTPMDNTYIVYDARVMEQWEDEEKSRPVEYFAEPSEEIDRNWHEIVEHHNVGIQEEVVKVMGRKRKGIKLPDGTCYGSIMVFHHMHCLVRYLNVVDCGLIATDDV
ncbi:hypothetical protein EK21DRAFT_110264 [Setomelanomma holmii]|uniref:Uncharacterized protein n=1 Tax=Setomelanomma holmii TaxID=210430 RepID=A0A9P4HBR5_9PLEO|nr:hypothetical protein EK21DRAFT_110264 [Setomelanomma holmii]